jgi:hypothetical protein
MLEKSEILESGARTFAGDFFPRPVTTHRYSYVPAACASTRFGPMPVMETRSSRKYRSPRAKAFSPARSLYLSTSNRGRIFKVCLCPVRGAARARYRHLVMGFAARNVSPERHFLLMCPAQAGCEVDLAAAAN